MSFVEDLVEGRHAGEPDAVGHFPIGLTRGIVAYADYSVLMRRPELGRVGVHMRGKCGRATVKSVASGALLAVNVRSRLEICCAGLDG